MFISQFSFVESLDSWIKNLDTSESLVVIGLKCSLNTDDINCINISVYRSLEIRNIKNFLIKKVYKTQATYYPSRLKWIVIVRYISNKYLYYRCI